MEENIRIQIYIFLLTLYGGLMIGIIYDIIDIFLHREKRKTKGRGVTDILFWMIALVVVLAILFYSNDGHVRAYILLGFMVGWLLYFWLLSPWIRKLIFLLIGITTNIGRMIITILLVPFKAIKSILYKPIIKILQKGEKAKKQLTKYCRMPKIIVGQFEKYKRYLEKKK